MNRHKSEFSDEQWEKIAPFLPEPQASPWGGSKLIPNRPCFEGILWVLRSGVRWKDLPTSYPSPSTCWRRLCLWEEQEVWLKAWRAFLAQLDRQGQLDWAGTIADGSFAAAKKGGLVSAPPRRAKVRSRWWWQDCQGVPLGNLLESAFAAEVTLIERRLARVSVPRRSRGRPRQKPARLIHDKAADR